MEILRVTIFACLAIVGLLPGAIKAQTDCSELSTITDVQVFDLGGQLVVVWQEPANIGDCGFENIMHRITYEGYETSQVVETADFFAYFDYAPFRCVPGVVTVSAYNDEVSTSITVEYYTETSQVENLSVTQDGDGTIVASWSEPEDSEFCNFIYVVTYEDDNANTVSIETSDLQAALDSVTLNSCVLATVIVTPINGQYIGVAATAEREGAINAVRNYALSEASAEVIAQFDPPLGIEFCELTYEVRESELDCYQKVVSVAAFNGRIYSEWVSDTIEVSIGSLSDLSVSVGDNTVDISWSSPSNAEVCSISYQVVYDGIVYTTDESSLTLFEAVVEACVETTISVSPVSSSGQVGSASVFTIQGELAGIENLSLVAEGNTVVATWEVPPNSSSCTLSYLLEYINESGSHIFVTTDTSYTFEYESCVDVTLSVSPHGEDGSDGSKTTVTLDAAC